MLKRALIQLAVLLVITAAAADAQLRQVQGSVRSGSTGAPLSGAAVTVPGTAAATLTNATGSFTLSVPEGAVLLRVSLIGYQAEEVAIPTGATPVQVALQEDVLNIEGVVITGQATTVARRNLANAVSTVTAAELVPVTAQTVERALQGKIAGANIQANSGAPGGGLQVDLRGVSSINAASEPLWVIDGVVVSNVAIQSNANAITGASAGSNASSQDNPVNRIADLNPDDIERIEVLKGASASAIYGSNASNGVIIVTTKRGLPGVTRITATQRVGFSQRSDQIGSRSFTREEAAATYPSLSPADLDRYFDSSGAPRQAFDLEELIADRSDMGSETSLSINGGDDNTRYYMSGLVLAEPGIIENTGYDKQSLRVNLDQRLSSRIDVGVNANVIHSLARRGITNNDNTGRSLYVALSSTPNFIDLRPGADGEYPENPFSNSNPLQTAAMVDNDEDVWRFISGVNTTVNLLDPEVTSQSLRLQANFGADYFTQENELFAPPEVQFEQAAFDVDNFRGTSLLSTSNNLNLNGNANLIHMFSPVGGVSATTSAGVQYVDRDMNIGRIVGENLIAGQRNVDAATAIQVFETRERVQTLGLYAQEELLLLDDRILLTGSLRADRSSANGDPGEFFLYPKASASYRFADLLSGLDELKLRVAYGESGNQPLFGQKFTALTATNNIQGLPALVVEGTAGDADITPERTREIEGGFDAVLLNGNANLEFTLYQQNITDLLLERTVAPSTGYFTQFFNGGELRTRGVEVALSATPVRTDQFVWVARATFSSNESVVTQLPVPSFRGLGFGTSLGTFEVAEGESATQIVGFVGLDDDGDPIVEQIGDANPDFRAGLANDLTFGNFNLYGLLDWQRGSDVINLTTLLYDLGQVSPDFELPEGVAEPRSVDECHPGCSGIERLGGFGTYTQPFIEDGSFVKLRELTLSYLLPAGLFGQVLGSVENARISLSGRNLFSIDDYSGLDPEVSNFGNQQIGRNIDVAPYPPSRTFWLSVSLGF
ncbi:MAG: SusC/RagA family TonB-linked outer membrane protein [Gemmatimonadota bacterium]